MTSEKMCIIYSEIIARETRTIEKPNKRTNKRVRNPFGVSICIRKRNRLTASSESMEADVSIANKEISLRGLIENELIAFIAQPK